MLLLTHDLINPTQRDPWSKGKLVGPKPPFKLREIWAIRIRLDIEHRVRELAMFNLAIDSKLRGCGLVRLEVSDVMHGHHAVSRAMVIQHKTQQPSDLRLRLLLDMLLKILVEHCAEFIEVGIHRLCLITTKVIGTQRRLERSKSGGSVAKPCGKRRVVRTLKKSIGLRDKLIGNFVKWCELFVGHLNLPRCAQSKTAC